MPGGFARTSTSAGEAAAQDGVLNERSNGRPPGTRKAARPGRSTLWVRLAEGYEIGHLAPYRFAWSDAEDPLTGESYTWVEYVSPRFPSGPADFRALLSRLPAGPVRLMWRGGGGAAHLPATVRTWYLHRRFEDRTFQPHIGGVDIAIPDPVSRQYVQRCMAEALIAGYGAVGPAPERPRAERVAGELLADGTHEALVATADGGVPVAHVTWSTYRDPVEDRPYLDIFDTWIEPPWQGRGLTETLLAAAVRHGGGILDVLGNVSPAPHAPSLLLQLHRAGWRLHGAVIDSHGGHG